MYPKMKRRLTVWTAAIALSAGEAISASKDREPDHASMREDTQL